MAETQAASAADVIRRERERIIEAWFKELAERIPDVTAWSDLTDHVPDLLENLAEAIEGGARPPGLDDFPRKHVASRLNVPGYDLAQLKREHASLRAAILRVLRENDPDPPSEVIETVTAVLDESVFESAEYLVRHLLEKAEAAIRAREEVIAMVAHDLRGPLQVMTSVSDRLRRRFSDERSQREIDMLLQAAGGMRSMVTTLLDLGRAESGHICVSHAATGADEALARAESFAREKARLKKQRIRMSNAAPGMRMAIDDDCIDRALANLVDNAVKFTPEGGEIWIALTRDDEAAVFSVADTGPGIPDEDLAFIFERFWQGSKRGDVGAGLGLAIVKGIARAHGGSVSAENGPEGGSIFRLRIPLAAD